MKIKYTLKAPISHIGETASTGSYFQTVLTSSGRVPVVTGNHVRGQIRNCIAMHMLDTIGETTLAGANVSKEMFHILFSGGNVNTAMRDDLGKARAIREHFPAISLMGGALGDMIMGGKINVGFVWPICKETEEITGISSNKTWHNMIDEVEFTRMDDAKNDKLADYMIDGTEEEKGTASQQMRYSVQYLAQGTELVQEIRIMPGVTALELGALYAGLRTWFENPILGGMSAKGFGTFEGKITYDEYEKTPETLISEYEDFLRSEGTAYFGLLESKGGAKRGKASNNAN